MEKRKSVQATVRIRNSNDEVSLEDAAALLTALREALGRVALDGGHLNRARSDGASRPFDVCIWPAALPPLETGFWALSAGLKIEASEVVRRIRTRAKLRHATLGKAATGSEALLGSTAPKDMVIDPDPWPPLPPSPATLSQSAPAQTLGRLTVGIVPGGPAQLMLSRRRGPLTAVARRVSTGQVASVATSKNGRLTVELPTNTADTVDAKGRLRLTWNNVYDVILLDGAFEPAEGNRVEVFRVSP